MARRCPIIAALFVVLALGLAPALAVQPDEVLDDPVLEDRARAISLQLRCLVCQNQSIDDSDAPLARDLRVLVRERLQAGDSDGDVMDFMVARYGEFVLMRPRMGAHTILLWAAPVVLLAVGGSLAFMTMRRRRPGPATDKLSEDEKRRIAEVLDGRG